MPAMKIMAGMKERMSQQKAMGKAGKMTTMTRKESVTRISRIRLSARAARLGNRGQSAKICSKESSAPVVMRCVAMVVVISRGGYVEAVA
jgi:hypothetical protein